MTFDGKVINGAIVLDSGAVLPEGARVRIELTDPDDLIPPTSPYNREQELAILREALADTRAGRTVPARDALKEIARRLDRPSEAGK
jgi:hypothetical protein